MSQDLIGKKVTILAVGAKGILSFKGTLTKIDQDFVALQSEKGGLLGGKEKQTSYFSKHSILGIRVEE